MKKILLILTISLCLFVSGCNNKNKPVENNRENVIKNQELDNLFFTKTSLVYDKDSTLAVELVNNSEKKVNIKKITAIIKDKKDKVITTLILTDNIIVESKQTKKVMAVSTLDLSNAYYIEYIIDKEYL